MAETGRAVVLDRFGGPDAMRVGAVPIPVPRDDEVLVRVAAASVNPVDGKIRDGGYPLVTAADLPRVLGRDLAGTIEAVGTRAHYMLARGEAVFAYVGLDRGAQADYVVVKAVELCAAPRTLDLVHAAALPLAAMTAWQGLFDHGGLRAGQRVLVHGGAGGVGHLAVQFARNRGATVYATCSADDRAFVEGLGAERAIDYRAERFEEELGDLDLVLDLLGGDTQARSWGTLRPGGMLVSTLDPDEAAAAAHGVRTVPRWHAEPNARQLGEVADLVDAGRVRVEVADTFPLADAAAAYARLAEGGVRGKLVLTLG